MDIALLVNITSKAWALKILALLHSGTSGRQAPLIAATKASRPACASSLAHLVQIGLVERNPGHGHPLRPEFRLTRKGERAAVVANQIVEAARNTETCAILRRNWTVPILAITETPKRFSIIKSGLGAITDRALSQSLSVLEEQDWLKREINTSQRAPFPTYCAVNVGRKINLAIGLNN